MSAPRRVPSPGWPAPGERVPLYGTSGTRRIEAGALSWQAGLPLMQRAGAACHALARALAPHARRGWVAAGPGNNGGDGMVLAALLAAAGLEVSLTFCGDLERLSADARAAHAQALAAGVRFVDAAPALDRHDLAVDALLGYGANRPPQGRLAALIGQLNATPASVLAVDVPSGLHADSGTLLGDCAVRADATLALLTCKPGLHTGLGRDHAGVVWFDDLGVELPADPPADAWLQGRAAPRPARRHAQHKGSFGDAVVVAGAPGMAGAARMAARAAQAAGAGKVFVSLLDPHGATVDAMHPELLFQPRWWQRPAADLARATVVCGCGGGDAVRPALPRLLAHAGRLVLDADALNAVARDDRLREALRARGQRADPLATVLTPHPLEAARLAGTTTSRVQADRLAAANQLADDLCAVIVLKGSGTVIAAPGRTPVVNASGNARLATAGTGDVLAGWLGGLWTQLAHVPPPERWGQAQDVAADAVYLHGAAAEPADGPVLRAAELVERLQRRPG